MKKLVNHGGIIQYKWVISNKEELHKYLIEIAKHRITNRITNWLHNRDSDKQIEQIYHLKQVGAIELVGIMLRDLQNSTEKFILQGKTLVFNENGGYCFLDENIKILDWKFLLECKDVVVLENASIIEEDVKDYCEDNNLDFLELTNLNSFTLEEIFYYCSNAKTIIFQTQAVDLNQLDNLLKLVEKLQPKEVIIINSESFPTHRKELSKHNLKII